MSGAPADLPALLDYTGEFGTELITFLPFVTWASRQGWLRGRRVRSYRGMRCFYAHLDCDAVEEKPEPRHWVRPQERPAWLPIRDEDSFDGTRAPCDRHAYPDLRAMFRDVELRAPSLDGTLPILVVHNKYNREWTFGRPVNFLSPAVLDEIFGLLGAQYRIVYIRHGMGRAEEDSYAPDQNRPLAGLGDEEVLARHPKVLNFDTLFAEHVAAGGEPDLNLFKNGLYARCWHFISAQGGGSYQCAYFSGALLMILHRAGIEHTWPYHGYFRWLADPPVQLAVPMKDVQLMRGVRLFNLPRIVRGRAVVGEGRRTLLENLSPTRRALLALEDWKTMSPLMPEL